MESKCTLVSVILCNYNYGRFLAESIESVLQQSYSNFELIIVDDGSTDNSREVISRYTDPRISTVFKQNAGQASSFNAGFERARGGLIAFLDSDDAWTADKLASTVPIIESENFSIVQHNLSVFDGASLKTKRIHPCMLPGTKNVFNAYLQQHDTDFFSVTSGILCRKKDLDRVFPLDVSWRICADIPLTRPLPLFGPVCTVPQLLGYYRIHGSNYWMNSAAQGRTLNNARREFEYVNQWLEKLGFVERMNFEASKYQRKLMVERLPRCHPLLIGHMLKEFAWDYVIYPLALRLKMRIL